MSDFNSKLERFTQHILDDAATERDDIMAKIEARRAHDLEMAEDDVLAETYEYIRKSVTSIRTEAGRKVSEKLLANKRETAVRREEIATEVFDKVRAAIAEFVASDEYPAHMAKLFEKAHEALGNPYDVVCYLRPEDMHLQEEFKLIRPGAFLEFYEGEFALGGLIMDCNSKQQRVDESFDTALSDLDGHFAELFGLSISE